MTEEKIYNIVKKDFLYYFNQSIKVKQEDSKFYLYNKELILKYKLSQINKTEFKLPKIIKWEDNIVLFKQCKKTKEFWIKYNEYWLRIQYKYLLNWFEISDIIKDILDKNTICKQYIPYLHS